jgi:hypothetical protein
MTFDDRFTDTTSMPSRELLLAQAIDQEDYDYANELSHPQKTLLDQAGDLKLLDSQGVDVAAEANRLVIEIENSILTLESFGTVTDQYLFAELAALRAIAGEAS